MSISTAAALVLAALSTTLTNVAYLRQHDAAAALPALSVRHPLQSLRLLITDRPWVTGFAMESGGFALYALALALGSLALVQSVAAGGIGVLAFAAARLGGHSLDRRSLIGVTVSVIGLLALAISLAGGSGSGDSGSTGRILLWLGLTAGCAVVVVSLGRLVIGVAAAEGAAAGLLFSIGDISTKLATQGGGRLMFLVTLVLGYLVGTSLLQIGYQRGAALTVAGLSTLFSTALPIAAGTVVLGEPVPSGAYGTLRVLSFGAVTTGAILLTRLSARGSGAATSAKRPSRDVVG